MASVTTTKTTVTVTTLQADGRKVVHTTETETVRHADGGAEPHGAGPHDVEVDRAMRILLDGLDETLRALVQPFTDGFFQRRPRPPTRPKE